MTRWIIVPSRSTLIEVIDCPDNPNDLRVKAEQLNGYVCDTREEVVFFANAEAELMS